MFRDIGIQDYGIYFQQKHFGQQIPEDGIRIRLYDEVGNPVVFLVLVQG